MALRSFGAVAVAIGMSLSLSAIRAAEPDAEPEASEEPSWACAVSLYGYAVPDADNYLNPNVTADWGALHLEGRWNYEAVDSGSIWAGANFHAGTKWTFDFTAMVGGVFGSAKGVAPGYRLSLGRDWFELASEGEYFIGIGHDQDDFLYSWTEMAGYPTEHFRLGLAAQRTRAYETGLGIQRGVFAGYTYKKFDVAAYVFNLGWESPTYVLALRFGD